MHRRTKFGGNIAEGDPTGCVSMCVSIAYYKEWKTSFFVRDWDNRVHVRNQHVSLPEQ